MKPFEANWLSQVDRYPLILDPDRVPGVQLLPLLRPDIQFRMMSMKNQIAAMLEVCPCKFTSCVRIAIPPFSRDQTIEPKGKIQLVVDLQTGHLYKSTESLLIVRDNYPTWQYYLQFLLSL